MQFFYKKHKLIPLIIDELKETQFQTSKENLGNYDPNINSICVLHNSICQLLGENVYIVKYVKHRAEIITTENTHSLIPVACYDILYYRNIDNIKTIQDINLKIDCFNLHHKYYKCALQKLLHIVDDSITKSLELEVSGK